MKNLILTSCLICIAGLVNLSCDQAREPFGENEKEEKSDQTGKTWNRVDTADETVKGIRVIFKFDGVTDSFIGTLENQNRDVVPKVRAKVRVFNREDSNMEYGPTTPEDLAPGEKIEVMIPAPGFDDFTTFTIHAEMG